VAILAAFFQHMANSAKLVAKICGNSGKKWQEIELLCAELWKNRETSGRNFNLQRHHKRRKITQQPLDAQVVVAFCGIASGNLVTIFEENLLP
jgi:hypothetical protein